MSILITRQRMGNDILLGSMPARGQCSNSTGHTVDWDISGIRTFERRTRKFSSFGFQLKWTEKRRQGECRKSKWRKLKVSMRKRVLTRKIKTNKREKVGGGGRIKGRKLQRSITSRRARSMQSLELNSFLRHLTRRASNVLILAVAAS